MRIGKRQNSLKATFLGPDHEFESGHPDLKNPSGNSWKGIFSTSEVPMSDSNGRYKRKVLTNKKGYTYRLARLVDFDGDLSRPWYILFYAWDIGKKKLTRKRVLADQLNSPSEKVRRKIAREAIAEINKKLRDGGYLETYKENKTTSAFNFHGYKLMDAFTYVEEYKRTIQKKSRSTSKEINYTRNTLANYITHEKLNPNLLLRDVTPALINRYGIYLRTIANVSNKTYNDRMGNIHTVFETLRKLDHTLWPQRNPAARIEKLQTTTKTHAAYSKEQLQKFVDLIGPKDAQLLLFIRFIYYTLARPKELRFIKVGHIQPDLNRVLLAGEHAKTDVEKFVGMSAAFKEIINASGILNYPPDYYVFTHAGTPGTKGVGLNYFYKRFRIYLAALGFKKLANYTLYSFKHTGAVQLYLATKDAALVQQQCRHTTLQQTTTYLRDLGLFVDFEALQKWKGF